MTGASVLRPSPLLLLAAALVALAAFVAPGAQPAQAQTTTVWSATLTAQPLSVGVGCNTSFAGSECSSTSVLTDNDFTYDNVSYEITFIEARPFGGGTSFLVSFNKDASSLKASPLTIRVGSSTQLAFSNASQSNSNRTLGWANTGVSWSAGDTVQLSLTEPRTASSDADLSGLTASASTSTSGTFSALTLSPSTFAAATTAYTASVENDRTHVKLTPTTSDSNATVQVGKGSSLTAVTSGQPSAAIALSLGANAITVKVTAEDGTTTKTYTVTVTRAAPVVSVGTFVVEALEGASSAVVTLTIDPVLPTPSSVRLVLRDPAFRGRLRDLPRTVALPAGTASVEVDLSANLPADNVVNDYIGGAALRLEAVNNAPYVVGSPQVMQLTVLDNDPPAAPLLFSTPGEEKLTAEWTRPAGRVDRYELRYKQKTAADRAATTAGDPSTGWVTLTQPDVPWSLQNQSPRLREITGLAGGTAYHLQVRANDGDTGAGNGWGDWSRLKTDTAYRGYAPLWSSTLTVKDLGHLSGDGCNGQSQCSAQLSSSSSFTYGGGRYNVLAVRVVRGSLQILLDRAPRLHPDQTRLDVGGRQFQFKDASESWGIDRNEDAWRLTWHGTGLDWSDGDTVSVSLVGKNVPAPPTPAPNTDLHPVRVHYDEMRDGEPVYNFNSMRLASPNPSTIPGTFERRVELRAYIPGTFGSADPEQGIVTTTHVMLRVRAHLDSTLAWAIGNVYGVTGSFAAFDNGGFTPAIALNPASKWTYIYIRVTNGSQSATHVVAIDPPPRTYTLSPQVSVTEGEEAALSLSLGSPAGAGGVSFTVSADYPDGGATAEDVGQFAATLTVPEGQQSARIIIPTVDDEAVEEDEERFTVRVAHVGEPAWAVDPEGTGAAVVTIVDNDEPPPPPAPPEGPEPWDIKVVPGDGTLTVTWNVGSRDGVEDSEIWHVLRWSQEPGVWNNPRDPRAVGKNDGLSVDPGLTSYTITDLKNGVATGVFIRSMVGHRNNMSERDGNSSEWVRTKGEQTTPVAPPNNAHTVADAIADATIANQSGTHQVSLSGVFSDADGDDLTITASSSNESVATVAVSNDTLTVTARSRGSATITVTARDSEGNSVSDAFDVTVAAAEAAQQQVDSAPGQVVNLSLRQVQPTRIRVEWEAPEDGGAVNSYQVVLSRDGEALSTRRPGAKKRHVVIRKLEPGASYTVSVRAKNAGGLSPEATAQITLTVSVGDPVEVPAQQEQQDSAQQQRQVSVNQPPTVAASISDITGLRRGDARPVSLTGVFADADGDALTVSAKSSATAVTASVAPGGASLMIAALSEGAATITVTADDGNGGTVSDSFTVTVAGNQAPTVAAPIGDISGLKPGDARAVSLAGVFADAEGDSLTLTARSSNRSVATVATDGASLTVTAVAEGTATITVSAADGNGGTVSDSFTVTVAGNAAPMARRSLGDISVTESETTRVLLEDTFRDADNDRLTISATSSDETVVRVSVDYNYYAMTVSALSAGSATVTVTADDGNGGRASESFAVTVTAQPAPSPESDSPAVEEAAAAEQEDVLVRYDTNGDGKISSAEYQAALPDLGFTLTLDELIRLRAAYVASAR